MKELLKRFFLSQIHVAKIRIKLLIKQTIILKKINEQNIKIISTFLDDWTIIKNEFNSKQKKYEYDLNVIEELDVYKKILKNKNEIQEQFSDCIEYVQRKENLK